MDFVEILRPKSKQRNNKSFNAVVLTFPHQSIPSTEIKGNDSL